MGDSALFDVCFETLRENICICKPEYDREVLQKYFFNRTDPQGQNRSFSDILNQFLNSCLDAEHDSFIDKIKHVDSCFEVKSISQDIRKDNQALNIYTNQHYPKIFYVEFNNCHWDEWVDRDKISLNFTGTRKDFCLKSIIFHQNNEFYCGCIYFNDRIEIKLKNNITKEKLIDLNTRNELQAGAIYINTGFVQSSSTPKITGVLREYFTRPAEVNKEPYVEPSINLAKPNYNPEINHRIEVAEDRLEIDTYRDSTFTRNIPFVFMSYRNVHNKRLKARICQRCRKPCPKHARKCFNDACRSILEVV